MTAMQWRLETPRRILVVAGSDSSGGAGLEADQKVAAAHGCYAMTATTALTAQNTQGVSAIFHVSSEFVVAQIDQCINDIGVDVVKIGMLASASTVDAVAGALQAHNYPLTVLDPVMISTSGAQLLPNSAVSNLLDRLLPITTILTPNIPEAKLLLDRANIQPPDVSSLEDLVNLAKLVHSLGPHNVLLKGGHFPLHQPGVGSKTSESSQRYVTDILITTPPDAKAESKTRATVFQTDHIPTTNTHGTGCSLASAIACNLAKGHDINLAVSNSVQYVERAIIAAKAWRLGKGSGPIDHLFAWRESDGGSTAESGDGCGKPSTMLQWDWEGQEHG